MFCGAVRSRIRLPGRRPVVIVRTLEIILRAACQRGSSPVAHQGGSRRKNRGKRVPLRDRGECRRKEDAVSSGAGRS